VDAEVSTNLPRLMIVDERFCFYICYKQNHVKNIYMSSITSIVFQYQISTVIDHHSCFVCEFPSDVYCMTLLEILNESRKL